MYRSHAVVKLFFVAVLQLVTLIGCGGPGDPSPSPPVYGPAWRGFASDAQHTAIAGVQTQKLSRVRWASAVDLMPFYVEDSLLIHYGSPVMTSKNTLIMPVKTGRNNSFRVEARAGGNGVLLWSAQSDYVLPESTWLPSYNIALTTTNRLYAPGAGGKLFYYDNADAPSGEAKIMVFYGAEFYANNKVTFDRLVQINTPITVDAQGNIFFGFVVTGTTNPANLKSGVARIGSDGVGTWVSASLASGDAAIAKVATNSAPALSNDGNTLYVAVNTAVSNTTRQTGYLLALNSQTLSTISAVKLLDPKTNEPATVSDSGTASPTVGPDDDVYFGVLESAVPTHHYRGWLLHLSKNLALLKTPGSFGWDTTASVVPVSMISSYTGASSYLIMTKYNNYAEGAGGDGKNRVAILDPNAAQPDAIIDLPVMKEVMTLLGPTPDGKTAVGVKEWCINTAAVDPFSKSILVNSSDGFLYRWDLTANSISERLQLTDGIGEAYTPTMVGADGAVYAISDATLFAIGR